MNITRLNFKETLPFILSTIQQANYVAVDLQMSGIVSNFTLDPSLADSIQNRYHKTKCKAQRFIPVQLGLCPLKIAKDKITYSPFNIYLYPLSLTEKSAQQFSFNSQSMRFLAKNNFDFNKLFYEGVPFLNPKKIQKFEATRQQIAKRQKQTNQYMLSSPDVEAFFKMKLQETYKWLSQSAQCQQDNAPNDPNIGNQNYFLIDIQFIRIRAYKTLEKFIKNKHPSLNLKFQYLDINKNPVDDSKFLARKYLKISKLTPSQLQNQQLLHGQSKQEKQKHEGLQLQSIQLNTIWQTMRNKKIPLLLHNGFLDLMHVYHRFIDELPASQLSYRLNVHKQFPIIFDTKFLCINNPVLFNRLGKDTSLGNCYKVLRSIQLQPQTQQNTNQKDNQSKQNLRVNENSKIRSQINQMCKQYSLDSTEHHQAGYDALMTAYTFVNAMKLIHYPPSVIAKPSFNRMVNYFCNKIPLGNIRVPYHFDSQNQNYAQFANKKFYFNCLQRKQYIETPQSIVEKQAEFQNFFVKKYGPVQIIWQDRDLFNFVLTFINPQHEQKFKKDVMDKSDYCLYEIVDSKFLVSVKALRQKKVYTASNESSDLKQQK